MSLIVALADTMLKLVSSDITSRRLIIRLPLMRFLDIAHCATLFDAKVIVLEYLRGYQAQKEKMSRSGKKNHKRVYWLRGKIMEWVRDLAFREGIPTVERNPAYMSQMCRTAKPIIDKWASSTDCRETCTMRRSNTPQNPRACPVEGSGVWQANEQS